MNRIGRYLLFFLSMAISTFGFSPINSFASKGNVLKKTLTVTSMQEQVSPLQLDKAVEKTKANSFTQIASHYSHSSHSSHASHYSHRSGY